MRNQKLIEKCPNRRSLHNITSNVIITKGKLMIRSKAPVTLQRLEGNSARTHLSSAVGSWVIQHIWEFTPLIPLSNKIVFQTKCGEQQLISSSWQAEFGTSNIIHCNQGRCLPCFYIKKLQTTMTFFFNILHTFNSFFSFPIECLVFRLRVCRL